PRDLETLNLLQMLNRIQNRMMFGFHADQMFAPLRATAGEAQNSKVVRFRSATCENQFVWFRAEQTCQLVARVVDRSTGLAPGGVHARRITELFLKKRQHRRSRRLT